MVNLLIDRAVWAGALSYWKRISPGPDNGYLSINYKEKLVTNKNSTQIQIRQKIHLIVDIFVLFFVKFGINSVSFG